MTTADIFSIRHLWRNKKRFFFMYVGKPCQCKTIRRENVTVCYTHQMLTLNP